MVDISEMNFEQSIEATLTQGTVVPQSGGAGHAGEAATWFAGQPGGYRKRTPEEIKVSGCIQDPSATGGETRARGYANSKFSGADH